MRREPLNSDQLGGFAQAIKCNDLSVNALNKRLADCEGAGLTRASHSLRKEIEYAKHREHNKRMEAE